MNPETKLILDELHKSFSEVGSTFLRSGSPLQTPKPGVGVGTGSPLLLPGASRPVLRRVAAGYRGHHRCRAPGGEEALVGLGARQR